MADRKAIAGRLCSLLEMLSGLKDMTNLRLKWYILEEYLAHLFSVGLTQSSRDIYTATSTAGLEV